MILAIEQSSKPIKQYDESDIARLAGRIVWWQNMLGVTTPLTIPETEDLIEHLQEFYEEMSMEEIELALKMTAAHRLDLQKTDHYNRFGIIYLGNVLAAYKKKKSEAHFIEMKTQAADPPSLDNGIVDADRGPDVLLSCYNRWLSNGELIDVADTAYLAAERLGLLKKIKGKKPATKPRAGSIASALNELATTPESNSRRAILTEYFERCKKAGHGPLGDKK